MKIRRKQLSYQNLPDCLEQFLICDSFVYKTFTNPVHKDKFNMTGFHFFVFFVAARTSPAFSESTERGRL